MNRYTIGIISRPHGVRGAVKVNPLTDDVARFKKLTKVFIDDSEYIVQKAQVSSNEVYLTLENVDTRQLAEALRNKEILVDKKDAVKLPKDRYFIVDIIGCECFVEDKNVGKVVDVLQHGAADVYVIKGDKDLMVPALKTLLKDVDCENKKIIFDKQAFEIKFHLLVKDRFLNTYDLYLLHL